jgi:hypothetical protein
MKKLSKIPKPAQSLEKQLEQLKQLRPGELRKRWQTLFGSAPAPRVYHTSSPSLNLCPAYFRVLGHNNRDWR